LHTDTSPTSMGGLVGSCSVLGTYNCSATGNVTCTGVGGTSGSGTGGLIGNVGSSPNVFTDCSATGDVSCNGWVGGFVGDGAAAGGDIYTRCSATGDVTGTSVYIGGFGGEINHVVVDCYAWGDVTGGVHTAGFVSNATGDFENVYSIGTATNGLTYTGRGDYTSCYWDTETSGTETSDGGTGHTTLWMKRKSNFTDAGWDMTTVWYQAYTANTEVVIDATGPTRVIDFVYELEQPYIIELGKKYMRFYKEAD